MEINIWNNLDEIGLFYGLERYAFETNDEFLKRLKKFSYWRYGSDYYNQSHSIPLQIGLDYYEVLKISSKTGKKFRCSLDWDYFIFEEVDNEKEKDELFYVRVFINTFETYIEKITNILSENNDIVIEILDQNHLYDNNRFLIRSKNFQIISEEITGKHIKLKEKNIFPGSFNTKYTDIFKSEKNSPSEIRTSGDYFLDYENGFLQIFDAIKVPIKIFYETFNPQFIIESTDCNLMPVNVLAKYGITDELIDLIPSLLDKKTWGK